jgi:signal peptidase I
LRVPEHLLTNLKLIANKRDIPYQSLLKYFLQEKVDQELQTPFIKLRRKAVKKGLQVLLGFIALSVATYGFLVQPIRAQGDSMIPTYTADSYYFLDKAVYKISAPQRGDVVVFASPNQANMLYFKRIIGLPGDVLTINNGNVYINGTLLVEPYVIGRTETKNFPLTEASIIIPGNSYFVLGDNRGQSTDSRDFGFIVKESILGKIAGCYWHC